MKVSKEEILGMLVALEHYLERDHIQDWSEWRKRAHLIQATASKIAGVDAEVHVPEIANHTPHVRITWDPEEIDKSPKEAEENLRAGDPSIEVKSDGQALLISVWMLRAGEEEVVAKRLRRVLRPSS